MKLAAACAFAAGSIVGFSNARAADDFEILPDVYGSCIAVNKGADGNVRNDCLSSASIYNRTDGSIYSCEAHLAVNVEGLQLTSTVAYKKASCVLANAPSKRSSGAASVAYKGDFAPRRSPAGGVASSVPARFYWRTRRDKLEADVCVDFVGFRAFSGCIDARLKQEAPTAQDVPAPKQEPTTKPDAPPTKP